MDKLKERIGREVESLADGLFAVSDFLLANPEIAYQEFKARDYLSRMLEHKGFDVEKGVGNVETSLLARPADCRPSRPTVALLAEYDALPKIGHGCGHNLIAAASLGAVVALYRILGDEAGGLVLDALILGYSSINAYRQHLRPDGRIHGIITHGGDAPNIIPDYAAGLVVSDLFVLIST